jgi:fructokinase
MGNILNHRADCTGKYQIGIDLGGTKTEAILLSDGKRELFRERVPTPINTNNNYLSAIESIYTLVKKALLKISSTDDYSIGIGIPGIMDKETEIIQHANTTWLANHNFKADLEERLEQEIFMENDANCFTFAESIGGAGRGYRMVFGIIMGTGCGGGMCVDGKIHSGLHGIAGEWGHIPIDPKGEECFCGNVGCIDTKLTGPGMVRAYKKLTGTDMTAEEIEKRAMGNDAECRQILDQFIDDFGKSVGGLISTLDPDAIVLGGGLSNIPELYTVGVEKIKKYAYHKDVKTPILKNILGDSAGVFGAAWLGYNI